MSNQRQKLHYSIVRLAATLAAFVPLSDVGLTARQPDRAAATTVTIDYDESSGPIALAAGEIGKLLQEQGIHVECKHLKNLSRQPVRMVLSATVPAVPANALHRTIAARATTLGSRSCLIEATASRVGDSTASTYWGIGGEPSGAMHAGRHIAESTRLNKRKAGLQGYLCGLGAV